MEFAQTHPIQDICLLVADVETSIRFYVEKLGFRLLHRAPGFADFSGTGVTLAVWDRAHIARHAGVRVEPGSTSAVLIAVRLDSPAEIDRLYVQLAAKDVVFVGPPTDHEWNARCAYFHGPDGETWELYAWLEGGAPGRVGEQA